MKCLLIVKHFAMLKDVTKDFFHRGLKELNSIYQQSERDI